MGENVEILVVEGSRTEAYRLQRILEQQGYQVSGVLSGTEALTLIASNKPAIVICESCLAETDGFELCNAIKSDQALKETPVILLLSSSDSEAMAKALSCGANEFLLKPYEESDLLSRVDDIIRRGNALKEAQRTIETLKSSYRALLDNSRDAIVIVDNADVVRYSNPAAETLFDRNAKEFCSVFPDFRAVAGRNDRFEITLGSGRPATLEMRVAESTWEGEQVSLATLRDVTELAEVQEKLVNITLVDSLTGLYNRETFFSLAEKQVQISNRTKRGFFLVVANLNNVKSINKTLGYHEGDLALIQTARILEESFRRSDILARIGEDEFGAIAVDASEDSGEIIAARLQYNVDDQNENRDRPNALSISFGIMRYYAEAPCTFDQLLAWAEQAMEEHRRGLEGEVLTRPDQKSV